jgi:hypothetical protein
VQEGSQQQLSSENAAVAAAPLQELAAYSYFCSRERQAAGPDNG